MGRGGGNAVGNGTRKFIVRKAQPVLQGGSRRLRRLRLPLTFSFAGGEGSHAKGRLVSAVHGCSVAVGATQQAKHSAVQQAKHSAAQRSAAGTAHQLGHAAVLGRDLALQPVVLHLSGGKGRQSSNGEEGGPGVCLRACLPGNNASGPSVRRAAGHPQPPQAVPLIPRCAAHELVGAVCAAAHLELL